MAQEPNGHHGVREWTVERHPGRTEAHERIRRPLWDTGMDPTHPNESDGPKGCTRMHRTHRKEPYEPEGAREWSESTRTNPTTPRTHGNGPNALQREPTATRAYAEPTRTNPTTHRANSNRPNVPETYRAHWNGMNAPDEPVDSQGAWEWMNEPDEPQDAWEWNARYRMTTRAHGNVPNAPERHTERTLTNTTTSRHPGKY